MTSTLTKLAQKPTDKTIRITRIIFALILIAVIYFGWDVTAVNFGLPSELKYAFYIYPLIGLIRGIFDPGLFRKKVWKWIIVFLGADMLIVSLFFIDDIPQPNSITSTLTISGESSLSLADLTNSDKTTKSFALSTDNWFGLFGIILIIDGLLLNSKNITSKNERYGEKVKKIRV